MSWLFGFYSKRKFHSDHISAYHPPAEKIISTSKYYIAGGGNSGTFLYGSVRELLKYFICGMGISENAEKFLDESDWKNIILNHPAGIDKLNGHFCGAIAGTNSITLFTDQLGLREFHIYEDSSGWYFSTKLDLLLKLRKFEIDFEQFGSRWLLVNQLSDSGIIKDVLRINGGTRVKFENNDIDVRKNFWLPAYDQIVNPEEFNEKLNRVVHIGINSGRKISLSLSGGLDSRLILSALLRRGNCGWDSITFKTGATADILTAQKIAGDYSFPHRLIDAERHGPEEILKRAFEYAGATYCAESILAGQNMLEYNSLPDNSVLIDGGFGEIWRREFLKRFYYTGRKALQERNYERIISYLKLTRAEIFNEEAQALMKQGVINQTAEIIDKLPPEDEIGFENWLDLFSVKTRLVNYYAPEQARTDNYTVSYMPFAQLYMLNVLFGAKDKNEKVFKKIIRQNSPSLAGYKLAKGNISYPFSFNPLMKRLYFRIAAQKKHSVKLSGENNILWDLKTFIMDSVSSSSAKSFPFYDYGRIKNEIEAYYSGDLSREEFAGWFATFEIFRQIMQHGQSAIDS